MQQKKRILFIVDDVRNGKVVYKSNSFFREKCAPEILSVYLIDEREFTIILNDVNKKMIFVLLICCRFAGMFDF